jgi:hypothetical protein
MSIYFNNMFIVNYIIKLTNAFLLIICDIYHVYTQFDGQNNGVPLSSYAAFAGIQGAEIR